MSRRPKGEIDGGVGGSGIGSSNNRRSSSERGGLTRILRRPAGKSNRNFIERDEQYTMALKDHIARPVIFAMIVVIAAILVFGIWGTFAQLDSAVIAKGTVLVDGKRKEIQHYEGGIVAEILVREGDKVEIGQPLLILNQSAAKTMVQSNLSLLRSRIVSERRLVAEMNNLEAIDFKHALLDDADPEVQIITKNQLRLFKTRKGEFDSNMASFKQDEIRIEAQLQGMIEQQSFMHGNLKMQKERLLDIEALHAKGIVSKHVMMATRREYQEMQSRLSHINSEIASLRQEADKVNANRASFEYRYYSAVAKEYEANHIELLDIENKYNHHLYVLERTTVISPVSGFVTGLRHHTVGGVVRPGELLMYIVPNEDDFIIEAYVAPHELNNIHVGTKAKVSLDPYKQRLVPRVAADVISVSADLLLADRNLPGMPPEYYLVKLRIKPETLDVLSEDVKLYPGMPVTVFLVRGGRTFLQYMISPITDSFHRAMKEQ